MLNWKRFVPVDRFQTRAPARYPPATDATDLPSGDTESVETGSPWRKRPEPSSATAPLGRMSPSGSGGGIRVGCGFSCPCHAQTGQGTAAATPRRNASAARVFVHDV